MRLCWRRRPLVPATRMRGVGNVARAAVIGSGGYPPTWAVLPLTERCAEVSRASDGASPARWSRKQSAHRSPSCLRRALSHGLDCAASLCDDRCRAAPARSITTSVGCFFSPLYSFRPEARPRRRRLVCVDRNQSSLRDMRGQPNGATARAGALAGAGPGLDAKSIPKRPLRRFRFPFLLGISFGGQDLPDSNEGCTATGNLTHVLATSRASCR